jgi:hypothetical protein
MAQAVAAFQSVLDRYTLDHLVHNRGEIAAVLFVERNATAAARPGRPPAR